MYLECCVFLGKLVESCSWHAEMLGNSNIMHKISNLPLGKANFLHKLAPSHWQR